jgi:hypothetical protein
VATGSPGAERAGLRPLSPRSDQRSIAPIPMEDTIEIAR